MARGANFKIGASSDRHNFRDWDDRFHQPTTHLTPEQITQDNIYLGYDLASHLSRENCKGFSRRIMRNLKKEYIETTDYGQRTGSVHSQTKLVLEANINLEHHHTKRDLEKLVNDLEVKLNVRAIYLMAHFDEGHIDKNGEVQVNSHAHFKFTPLVDGQITRRDKIWVRKAQDVVAESLGMERGEDVRESDRKGMGHKAYRQSKRNEEKLTKEIKKSGADDELKLVKKELRRLLKEISSVARYLGEEKTKQAEYSAVKQADSVDSVNDLMAIAQHRMQELKKIAKKRKLDKQAEETKAEFTEREMNMLKTKLRGSEAVQRLAEKREIELQKEVDKYKSVADKSIEWMLLARDRLVSWFKADIKQAKTITKLEKVKAEIDDHPEIQEHEPSKKELDTALNDKHKELNPTRTRSRGR